MGKSVFLYHIFVFAVTFYAVMVKTRRGNARLMKMQRCLNVCYDVLLNTQEGS